MTSDRSPIIVLAMYQFWEIVIEPMLEAARPESIVEIGSDKGNTTRNLLAFAERTGATVHSIDPLPRYDVDEWRERYGEHFVFHRALSLEALPHIDRIDAILIDGDHNWYTVFNELKMVERRSEETGRPFPLVMLHDVGWPCARRDLYYIPETIPAEYRHPCDLKGLRPGVEGVLEEGGFFPQLYALREGGPRNGILTAVEDFMEETALQLELVTIPGFYGLGLLIPSHLEDNMRLAEILQTWRLPASVRRYIERIEEDRVEMHIHRDELRERLQKLRARREERGRRRAGK